MIVLFLSYASSHAYRTVEASAIAPFEYVAIPSSVVWGVLIWNDWPNALALAGIGLILAGGLYRLFREKQRAVDAAPAAPVPAKRSRRK
ncbi:MAG: DMT family transporter [Alphaproteobacteria bacterium]|nr:DMT family transporter [Alphaproteobacteria bacterium]